MDEKNYTSNYTCSFGSNRMYMESHSCDVEKYVGLLVHSEKYFEIVHANEFTKVSLIHTSPVICKLDGFKVGIGFSIL